MSDDAYGNVVLGGKLNLKKNSKKRKQKRAAAELAPVP